MSRGERLNLLQTRLVAKTHAPVTIETPSATSSREAGKSGTSHFQETLKAFLVRGGDTLWSPTGGQAPTPWRFDQARVLAVFLGPQTCATVEIIASTRYQVLFSDVVCFHLILLIV